MSNSKWPPAFTLDQERILTLLTGDRFYSNPSAALREGVLNAVDAVHRVRQTKDLHQSVINLTFNTADLTLTIADNGTGMGRNEVNDLFTKVGSSAATAEAKKSSVGEFGIGVISYFMAADYFDLMTYNGHQNPIGLRFSRQMLAGGDAVEIPPAQQTQGTTIILRVRDEATFALLRNSFTKWCKDVDGLTCRILPSGEILPQAGYRRSEQLLTLKLPPWIERSHLCPTASPTDWDAMTGTSKISVLYRGVFVQEFEVRGLWGISGSIDVDPKHFKPKLNREGFIEGKFQSEVEGFLKQCHPVILESMADVLSGSVQSGELNKWNEKRWASLWLSIPRSPAYAKAFKAWDTIFRTIPAFEHWTGNKWKAISLDQLILLGSEVFVAPLADEKVSDVVKAAMHLLRNTDKHVIRGVQKDKSWMRYAPTSFSTTADLITTVFSKEIPIFVSVSQKAEELLSEVSSIAPLYTGPPSIDLAKLGPETPPALKLKSRLVINIDNPKGAAIVRDTLDENRGPNPLISITARHAHEQLSEVAAAVRGISNQAEVLSPVRRRFIRSHLQ